VPYTEDQSMSEQAGINRVEVVRIMPHHYRWLVAIGVRETLFRRQIPGVKKVA